MFYIIHHRTFTDFLDELSRDYLNVNNLTVRYAVGEFEKALDTEHFLLIQYLLPGHLVRYIHKWVTPKAGITSLVAMNQERDQKLIMIREKTEALSMSLLPGMIVFPSTGAGKDGGA